MTTKATSLLLPQPHAGYFIGEILSSDSTATTYALSCVPEYEAARTDCEQMSYSLTLGPWAEETPPTGAPETGDFDLEGSGPTFMSIHCQMSRSVASECTLSASSYNEELSTTLDDGLLRRMGYKTMVYSPVGLVVSSTSSSGQEGPSDTVTTTSDMGGPTITTTTTKPDSSDPQETGDDDNDDNDSSAGDDNEAPEDTDGALARLPSVLAAVTFAALATMLMM